MQTYYKIIKSLVSDIKAISWDKVTDRDIEIMLCRRLDPLQLNIDRLENALTESVEKLDYLKELRKQDDFDSTIREIISEQN